MNYIVLDLEATCWNDGSKNKSEIIEIGAVKVNANFEIVGEFAKFVKPKLNPQLSAFCRELTTITQVQVDDAEHFPIVIEQFKNWINITEDYLLCSWGMYDKNQFISDCNLNKIDSNWALKHISLKHQYPEVKGLKKMVGMNGALYIEGFTLEGTHHRGIDDARNICKIFLKHKGSWEYI